MTRVTMEKHASTTVGRGSKDAGTPLVSVIIPTYCEAKNLPELIPAVHRVLKNAGLTHEIIVVDDDSPDGTAAAAEDFSQRLPVRVLVRRGRRDLSSAVLEGFYQASGDVLVCMDADGSHPPEALPELVAGITDDRADFVLGSRYIAGGSIASNWGLLRRIGSRLAGLLARPLTGVRDPMSGYFALSRQRFRAAHELNPIGYKIGLELMVKTEAGRCLEIPIHFRDRSIGRSKLRLRQQVQYLIHLGRLFAFRLRRGRKSRS